MSLIPCSLYIHLPWCIKKCPYCDFNSHTLKNNLPEQEYLQALTQDLLHHLAQLQNRPLMSIFFGGGTPSLFSPEAIAKILTVIRHHSNLTKDIEITLEANPGTLTPQKLTGYLAAGINRLSIGVQSLNNQQLNQLGRIHDSATSIANIQTAQDIGFNNINIDIMYGLPQQSTQAALYDLQQALDLQPTHLSWYQLTIEPNTQFYHTKPTVPPDEILWDIQEQGQAMLKNAGFMQYEISAYSKPEQQCKHNLNYWQFGDYLGIGAGAHSKITNLTTMAIKRHWQVKNPRQYLQNTQIHPTNRKQLTTNDIIFEFMLNNLRLNAGISLINFKHRTNLCPSLITPMLLKAQNLGLLTVMPNHIMLTALGTRFVNDLALMFLAP